VVHVARHRVLVSAHRCGYAELGTGSVDRRFENTLVGLAHSVAIGADYVEFDVRRCADGTFVVAHDPEVGPDDDRIAIKRIGWDELQRRAPAVLRLSQFLEGLAPTGVGAHVDMKFATPPKQREAGHVWEHDLLEVLVGSLDPAKIIMTTGNGDATAAMRDWVEARGLPVLVGLSIGASVRGLTWREAAMRLYGQLFPRRRFEVSRADAVAAHFALAMVRLARWTHRIGVPLLVWTVDDPRLQRRLLRDPRVWMITTNRPARAVQLRDGP
jgi:glycerophosphoryl diester phosphodiesterase